MSLENENESAETSFMIEVSNKLASMKNNSYGLDYDVNNDDIKFSIKYISQDKADIILDDAYYEV